jgi:hypothetical protein
MSEEVSDGVVDSFHDTNNDASMEKEKGTPTVGRALDEKPQEPTNISGTDSHQQRASGAEESGNNQVGEGQANDEGQSLGDYHDSEDKPKNIIQGEEGHHEEPGASSVVKEEQKDQEDGPSSQPSGGVASNEPEIPTSQGAGSDVEVSSSSANQSSPENPGDGASGEAPAEASHETLAGPDAKSHSELAMQGENNGHAQTLPAIDMVVCDPMHTGDAEEKSSEERGGDNAMGTDTGGEISQKEAVQGHSHEVISGAALVVGEASSHTTDTARGEDAPSDSEGHGTHVDKVSDNKESDATYDHQSESRAADGDGADGTREEESEAGRGTHHDVHESNASHRDENDDMNDNVGGGYGDDHNHGHGDGGGDDDGKNANESSGAHRRGSPDGGGGDEGDSQHQQVRRVRTVPIKIDFASGEAYQRAMHAGEQLREALDGLRSEQHAVVRECHQPCCA